MFDEINQVIRLIDTDSISKDRKEELQVIIAYIKEKRMNNSPVLLNFICTHNSRRSQFTQIWADVAAQHHGIKIETFSGGVEVTECNPRTIRSLKRLGFKIKVDQTSNPHYEVLYSSEKPATVLFSKLFDDSINPTADFAAIMTCSHADENCPFVLGCEKRISLTYDDPKFYDDSPLEYAMYDARSFQIATEMFHVFESIKYKPS